MNFDPKENASLKATVERDCLALLIRLMPTLDETRASILRRGDFPWDSLKHIELINAVEDHFGVQISADAALNMNDFKSIVKIVLTLKSSV